MTSRRWLSVLAWLLAGIVGYAFFLRISDGARIDSDGANSALQAWDLIHGHLLLHGWLFGDATFYTFELPVIGVAEVILGLGPSAVHAASALTYLAVTACAVALAVTGSHGPARVARGALVVTVLAAPLLTMLTVYTLVEEPDHPGTAVFLLGAALLIDRLPDRKWTAPLVGLILCAGQLGDATVRYVGVPAVVAVCGYRVLATRKWRSFDAAMVLAAAASVPAETLVRAAIVRLGGYQMVTPQPRVSPPGRWPGNARIIWLLVRYLYGAVQRPDTTLGAVGAGLGLLCLVAAIAGLVRVAWTWGRASRAEQLVAAVLVINVAAYLISTPGAGNNDREIAAALPCGAVLAARALVPANLRGRLRGYAAAVLAAGVALVPLSFAAARPSVGPAMGPAAADGATAQTGPLTAWLDAHGFSYGLAGYWDASVVTLQSGGKVSVRAVLVQREAGGPARWEVRGPWWETSALWYDPAWHDATFVVADAHGSYSVAAYESFFGKPAASYRLQDWVILDYRRNLLREVLPHLPQGVGRR